MVRRNPGFSALIVLIVALGVGAAATIFSVVEKSLLWNENPNVDRWIVMRSFFPRQNLDTYRLSAAEYFDLRGLTDVFERVGAIAGCNLTLYRDNYPELIAGACASADMIPMTASAPILGRIFTPEDDKPGAPLTVVLTYELWQRRFLGDRGILGQTIRLNDDHYIVIGIMPPHYELWDGEFYIPFQLNPANTNRTDRRAWVTAITRRGVSLKQVNARVNQLARTWEHDHLGTNPEYQGLQLSTRNIRQAIIAGVRPALLILMGVVGLIVLISCANIGNLVLARASARRREMAVREALGAPQLRIILQLLTESLVLAIFGGGLGVLLAMWGVPSVVAMVPAGLPYSNLIRVDPGTILLALAVATFMGIVFGLVPAVYSSRGDLARSIREGGLQFSAGREGRYARSALIVSQIALAMIVLAGAGLMVRTYRELLRIDFGYDPHNVLTAQLALPGQPYSTVEKIAGFHRELLPRVAAIPGVKGAAVATSRPMGESAIDVPTQDFFLAGHEGEKNVPNANLTVASPEYFNVLGIPLLHGRTLSVDDTAESEPVAVINQTMAKLYWPKQDPVGQSIRLDNHYGLEPDSSQGRWVKIVGVVANAHRLRALELPVREEIFFPVAQRLELSRVVTLIVRSDVPRLTDALRHAVAAIDSERPVFGLVTLEQAISVSFAPKRMMMVLLGLFAVVAITLASVGLYAVMAYSVAQRTHDIGIRMALGATPWQVMHAVLGEGWRLAILGLVAGTIGALVATRLMRSLVFEVSTSDPLTFFGAASLLGAVALTACYIPARRATQVDPMIALRYE
jgi:putative ABC transport system permease protein